MPSGGVWADLGSGEGAFTLALADLLGPSGRIHSVDTDERALRTQQKSLAERFPGVDLEIHRGDFTGSLELPDLDGIVMANSLHFHVDHAAVVRHVTGWLKPGGRFVLVEYDADRGNTWVPHPISYKTWKRVAEGTGFRETRLLHRVPSRFLGAIYSALSVRP